MLPLRFSDILEKEQFELKEIFTLFMNYNKAF